ncbi:MAG: DUF2314 domain-containing protein [Planctomycetales bacterium]|nr:DUF2314 domain-containing protein [Planctomycetales bacterium]
MDFILLTGPALVLAAAWLLCVMWWRGRRAAAEVARPRTIGDVLDARRSGERSSATRRSAQPTDEADDETAPVSLVLLLSEPRFLDECVLDRLARRALRLDESAGLVDDRLVIGDAPTFLICGERFTFLVNNYAEPYVENLDAVSGQIADPRLRRAVRRHRAWISVDLVSVDFVERRESDVASWDAEDFSYDPYADDAQFGEDALAGDAVSGDARVGDSLSCDAPTDGDADSLVGGGLSRHEPAEITPAELDEAYRWMGRLIAELADSDCVAIFSPATDQMSVFDAEIEDQLRRKHPLDVFAETTLLPVVEIDQQAASVQSAIAEAQRRWPEFERAFGRRGDDQFFAVKAPFCQGDLTEFMWLVVTAVENGVVYGRLDNDPAGITRLRRGDVVRVAVDHVNDWLFQGPNRLAGGFTLDAVHNRHRRSFERNG